MAPNRIFDIGTPYESRISTSNRLSRDFAGVSTNAGSEAAIYVPQTGRDNQTVRRMAPLGIVSTAMLLIAGCGGTPQAARHTSTTTRPRSTSTTSASTAVSQSGVITTESTSAAPALSLPTLSRVGQAESPSPCISREMPGTLRLVSRGPSLGPVGGDRACGQAGVELCPGLCSGNRDALPGDADIDHASRWSVHVHPGANGRWQGNHRDLFAS